MEQAIFTAPDISCSHCQHTIETAVGDMDGVASVTVDVATTRIAITFDPDRTSPQAITAILDEEGYPVAAGDVQRRP